MNRVWEELQEFPDYAVSSFGEIANMKTGMPRKLSINQHGIVKISLYQGNQLLTRSVAVLVAETFLPKKEDSFDTPIHLDGNRLNCSADNLMWRPRWFAIKYHKQFMYDIMYTDKARRVDVDTGVEYENMMDVCVRNGVYYYDVLHACNAETFVPITFQEFRYVD